MQAKISQQTEKLSYLTPELTALLFEPFSLHLIAARPENLCLQHKIQLPENI